MAFYPNDFYTTSGTATVTNSWTSTVYKHDPSSFYNWEQDNEPLHDLEERTYMNWEHAGFHTSSVPGMVLTVSADTPAATLVASSNIFTTVSAAIEALPSDIRFPILIEIANFGYMGELNLENIKIGYGGSLEIINRNFVKVYSMSGGPESIVPTCFINRLDTGAANTQYKMINQVSSVDASAIWYESSAVHIKTPVLAQTAAVDSRLSSKINSVFQPLAHGIAAGIGEQCNSRLSVSIAASVSSGPSVFDLPIYEVAAAALAAPHKVLTHDVSARDLLSDGLDELISNQGVAQENRTQGMMYGNYLTKLTVNNCTGPIYVRNFFVDSSNHNIDGVQVFNSNDVWLENCTSIKNKVGFNFKNSKVYLNRGIVAYFGADNVFENHFVWEVLKTFNVPSKYDNPYQLYSVGLGEDKIDVLISHCDGNWKFAKSDSLIDIG